MIEITTTPLEQTRTANSPCYYLATCTVDGQPFEAKSRLNACTNLARLLVEAGIADQEVQIRQPGIAGHLAWKSLHYMATRMYVESASKPLHTTRWRPSAFNVDSGALRDTQNEGSSVAEGSQ